MANAAQNAPKIESGKLSPEDAERLASSFRPIWELDDAPFTLDAAQGNGLSAADVDALGAGAGVSPSIRNTEAVHTGITEIKSMPPGFVPRVDDPKVEIAVEVTPPIVVAQAQPQVASITIEAPQQQQAQATVPRKPYTPPRAPPPTVKLNRDAAGSGEFVPVKKSNTGLILGAVGVVVLIGAIFGIRAAMSGDKTQTAASATTTATHEEAHIPPPPPPDTVGTVAAQAPTQTAQTQQATQPPPPPVQTTAPVATHQTSANIAAPVHNNTTHTTATHTGASKPTHATIVRDNPF